jgi:putative FmdB family regulatory protein
MPVYEYQCPSCEAEVERTLPIKEFNQPQSCECGATLEIQIPSGLGMVLKGDGWPGKALKIKGQMTQKNRRIGHKQAEKTKEAPDVKLIPNVGGEQVESWSEAQSLAASQGKDTTSYEPLIQKEKG